jgi:ElaB/YqjD/DUF883 family membrane-anchored ribosome-binding protein
MNGDLQKLQREIEEINKQSISSMSIETLQELASKLESLVNLSEKKLSENFELNNKNNNENEIIS